MIMGPREEVGSWHVRGVRRLAEEWKAARWGATNWCHPMSLATTMRRRGVVELLVSAGKGELQRVEGEKECFGSLAMARTHGWVSHVRKGEVGLSGKSRMELEG